MAMKAYYKKEYQFTIELITIQNDKLIYVFLRNTYLSSSMG